MATVLPVARDFFGIRFDEYCKHWSLQPRYATIGAA